MKKQTIILALFLCIASYGYGQLSLRGGVNYSQVSVDGGSVDLGEDPKVGYHIGLQGDLGLPGLFSIRPALLYHLKGGKGADQVGETDLSYIEVPVNLAIRVGGESLRVIVEGGPYFGYLVNVSSDLFSDLDDNLNKSDWGANFGAAVELGKIGLGVNYSNSLSSISGGDQISEAIKTKNGNLALFAYLKF